MERLCEICGHVIPNARLEALPDTHRCVVCAAKKGSDIMVKNYAVGMDIDTYKDLLSATRS